jgi:WG containing repeat
MLGLREFAFTLLLISLSLASAARGFADEPKKHINIGVACDFPRGLCGVRDDAGNVIIEPTFEWLGSFQNDYAHFAKAGLLGLIDQAGRIVIPAQFHGLGSVINGSLQASDANRVGLINLAGQWIVPPQYGAAVKLTPKAFLVETRRCEIGKCWSNGSLDLGSYCIQTSSTAFGVCEKASWHIVDKNNRPLSSPPIEDTSVLDVCALGSLMVKNAYGWRLFSTRHMSLIGPTLSARPHQLSSCRWLVDFAHSKSNQKNSWGVIDGNGKSLFRRPTTIPWIEVGNEQIWISETADSSPVAYNYDGKLIDPPRRDRFNRLIRVSRDIKWGALGRPGAAELKAASGSRNDTKLVSCPDGIRVGKMGDQFVIEDSAKNAISDVSQLEPTIFCEGLTLFRRNGLTGLTAASGQILVEPGRPHDNGLDAGYAFSGMPISKLDGLYGALGYTGHFAIKPVYSQIWGNPGASVDATITGDLPDGERHRLNRKGEIVSLDRIECFGDYGSLNVAGLQPVRQGDLWGYQDLTGTWIIASQFVAATCHATDRGSLGLAYAAFPDRRAWCPIDKTGVIVQPEKCVPTQQLLWSHGHHWSAAVRSKTGTFDDDLKLALAYIAGRWREDGN